MQLSDSLVAHTDDVVATPDPVLRNLRVTQGYHDLAHAFAALVGTTDRNWCHFAIWASRTAGRFIRDDEVPALFRQWLHVSPRLEEVAARLAGPGTAAHDHPGVLGPVCEAIADVQWFIMTGNTVVFAEIGELFSRFVRRFDGARERDPSQLAALLDHYTSGDAQPDEVTRGPDGTRQHRQRGGQGWLRAAATEYFEAMWERDPRRRAQRMLLANAYTGLHEQTRLQTYIEGSLDAPLTDVLIGAHRARTDQPASRLEELARGLLAPLGRDIEALWASFSTVALMTLALPDGTVRLGENIEALPGQPLYPPALQTIDEGTLRALLDRYGAGDTRAPSVGETLHRRLDEVLARVGVPAHEAFGTRAVDWRQLDERMRYILPLFRSRQADTALDQQPFTVEQRAAILGGRIPDGPLS